MASYTGAVDCRNLKYQGTLQGRTYAGIGMVLEQDFTFVVSDWKGVLPSGHTLLVLPSRDYFYGNLGNNRPDGVCSLSMDNQQTVFLNYIRGVSEKMAVVLPQSSILEFNCTQPRISLVRTHSYSSEREKFGIIASILNAEVPKAMESVIEYAQVIARQHPLLDCASSNGKNFLGFRNESGLGVWIVKDTGKIVEVGSFAKFPRKLQFGRKYAQNPLGSLRISEGVFSQAKTVHTYEGKRPLAAIRETEEEFKRGTNFENVFVRIPLIDELKLQLNELKEGLKSLKVIENGQAIMDKVSAERQDTSKQYTIEEMKQKIQKEVERKHIIQGSTQRNGAAKLAKHDESPFGMGRSTDWRDTFAWKSPQRSVNEFTLHPIDILRYQQAELSKMNPILANNIALPLSRRIFAAEPKPLSKRIILQEMPCEIYTDSLNRKKVNYTNRYDPEHEASRHIASQDMRLENMKLQNMRLQNMRLQNIRLERSPVRDRYAESTEGFRRDHSPMVAKQEQYSNYLRYKNRKAKEAEEDRQEDHKRNQPNKHTGPSPVTNTTSVEPDTQQPSADKPQAARSSFTTQRRKNFTYL